MQISKHTIWQEWACVDPGYRHYNQENKAPHTLPSALHTYPFFRSRLPLVIMFAWQMLSSPQCLSPVLEHKIYHGAINQPILIAYTCVLDGLFSEPCCHAMRRLKQPHGEDWERIKPLSNSPRWALRQRWHPQLAVWTDWHPGASVNIIWSLISSLAAHRSPGGSERPG